MDLQLKGKVAIVTGASRGIGRAIAETFAMEGMRVAIAARSRDQLEAVARTFSGDSLVFAADLRDADAPARLVDEAASRFGQIDVLVNNAGATQRGDFLELSEEAWTDGFALKFLAAVRCSRAAWPHLQASRGSIINISGVGGRTGSAEFTIGGAVNAALLNLTKALADRGIRDGVRVNAINPGSIATERLHVRVQRLAKDEGVAPEEAQRRMAEKLGVPRFGDPMEIARAVAFMASPQAGYCQGAILDVDGGQTRTL